MTAIEFAAESQIDHLHIVIVNQEMFGLKIVVEPSIVVQKREDFSDLDDKTFQMFFVSIRSYPLKRIHSGKLGVNGNSPISGSTPKSYG